MSKLKGTKTAENLMKAFAGESQARSRYTFFAEIAEKEGFIQIRNIFNETAENEREHAKRFYYLLVKGLGEEVPTTVDIKADYPVASGNTLENLKAAAAGENEEWADLYPAFAQVAKEEGFTDVAVAFTNIAKVEKKHEERYKKLADNMKNEKVFVKEDAVYWKCINCGYIHEGKEAPKVCPACLFPQSYFEVFKETY